MSDSAPNRVTLIRREWLKQTWLRMISLWKRQEVDRDLEDELAFHLARREQKNREAGIK